MEQGEVLALIGMSEAANSADLTWMQAARGILKRLVDEKTPFTADDIWFWLDVGGFTTPEPRALGALIKSTAQAGAIKHLGYRATTRPEAHHRPVSVWVGV